MEYLGCFAFVFIMIIWGKVNKLEKRVRKLARQGSRSDEENDGRKSMSKLIEELVGKHCVLNREEDVNLSGRILGVDEEWIKLELDARTKKETEKEICLVRIDEIAGIDQIKD